MLGGTFGGLFVAFILLAPAPLIAWGGWEFIARRNARRFAWMICGFAGTPALAFAVLYLFGWMIAIAFAIGVLLAFSRRLDHVASAVYIGGYFALGIVSATRDVSPHEWFGTMLILGSILAALLAVTKLGHMLGQRLWGEERRSRDRERTAAGANAWN